MFKIIYLIAITFGFIIITITYFPFYVVIAILTSGGKYKEFKLACSKFFAPIASVYSK